MDATSDAIAGSESPGTLAARSIVYSCRNEKAKSKIGFDCRIQVSAQEHLRAVAQSESLRNAGGLRVSEKRTDSVGYWSATRDCSKTEDCDPVGYSTVENCQGLSQGIETRTLSLSLDRERQLVVRANTSHVASSNWKPSGSVKNCESFSKTSKRRKRGALRSSDRVDFSQ